jgi:hypothetical protein
MAAKKVARGSTTKVAKCSCKHAFQDAEYGDGNRVYNRKANGTHVCTVCGKAG